MHMHMHMHMHKHMHMSHAHVHAPKAQSRHPLRSQKLLARRTKQYLIQGTAHERRSQFQPMSGSLTEVESCRLAAILGARRELGSHPHAGLWHAWRCS
jgi:hypothetical protein